MTKDKESKNSGFIRFAKYIEKVGNKLPHPFYLFLVLIGIVLIASFICSKLRSAIPPHHKRVKSRR